MVYISGGNVHPLSDLNWTRPLVSSRLSCGKPLIELHPWQDQAGRGRLRLKTRLRPGEPQTGGVPFGLAMNMIASLDAETETGQPLLAP